MLATIRYWMRDSNRRGYRGPLQAVVLLNDGTLVDVPDLTDCNKSEAILSKIVLDTVRGVFLRNQKGWTGEAQVPGLRGPFNVYTSMNADFEYVKADLLAKVQKAVTEYEQNTASPEATLEALLATHDWYSAYSDDHRAWAAGEADMRRILDLSATLPKDKANTLFAKYNPEKKDA